MQSFHNETIGRHGVSYRETIIFLFFLFRIVSLQFFRLGALQDANTSIIPQITCSVNCLQDIST